LVLYIYIYNILEVYIYYKLLIFTFYVIVIIFLYMFYIYKSIFYIIIKNYALNYTFEATNKCWAAFTERYTYSNAQSGNNVGACSLNSFYFCIYFSTHAIHLTFADLESSNIKSLSRTDILFFILGILLVDIYNIYYQIINVIS
jgi:hypothetical protein